MDKFLDDYPQLRLQEYEFLKPADPAPGNKWIPTFAGMTQDFGAVQPCHSFALEKREH
jgi:hypothetical protein